MSLYKRVKGDFTIESIDSGDQIIMHQGGGITIDGGITIAGDLTVTGDSTTVSSTDIDILDNTIVLNSGESGPGITKGEAGIEIDRGTALNVGIRYNETLDRWEANDVDVETPGEWYPILGQSVVPTFDLVDDLTPQLGGHLDVNGKLIINSQPGTNIRLIAGTGAEVKIDPVLALRELDTELPISADLGKNKVYAAPVGTGGSGIYVTNSETTDELVSKKKAIVFSLIF